jgi:myo-inositol-1(or 4)-monophosphatase
MTASPDLADLLPVALDAATVAADLIRTRRPTTVTEKSDRDLVSDVDVAIERAVRGMLREATPGIAFLGEEEGGTDDPTTGWVWTLDPIDGTSNYSRRVPLCAASLALLQDGKPVLGVIDAPLLAERYHAAEGHGAWTGDRKMRASSTASLHDAIVAIGDYATGTGAGRKNETMLATTVQLTSRVHRIRMLGTAALDLAWLADGRLDASITMSNIPWDMAAGVIIAREAGAEVVDADGTPHTMQSAATIGASPRLLAQLLPLLQAAAPPDTRQTLGSPSATLDAILGRARHLIYDFDGVISEPASDLADAAPVPYVHEALAATRDSGRVVAIITDQPLSAVSTWLDKHGLDSYTRHITTTSARSASARHDSYSPLADAISDLGATAANTAIVAVSPERAHGAGIAVITYVPGSDDHDHATSGSPDCPIASLADLTLRLRARPMPT